MFAPYLWESKELVRKKTKIENFQHFKAASISESSFFILKNLLCIFVEYLFSFNRNSNNKSSPNSNQYIFLKNQANSVQLCNIYVIPFRTKEEKILVFQAY